MILHTPTFFSYAKGLQTFFYVLTVTYIVVVFIIYLNHQSKRQSFLGLPKPFLKLIEKPLRWLSRNFSHELDDLLSKDGTVNNLFSFAEQQILEIGDHDFNRIQLWWTWRKENVLHSIDEKRGFNCRRGLTRSLELIFCWSCDGFSIEVDLVHIADQVHAIIVELEDLAATAIVDLSYCLNEVLFLIESVSDAIVDDSLWTHRHHHWHIIVLRFPLLLVVLVRSVAGLDAEKIPGESSFIDVDQECGIDEKRLDDGGVYPA